MTLPFQILDKNKKKYQCFCCATEFTEFEAFKTHITEEHEEGRDYVLCPLQRCQAPVRCLKTHFKVKHPREKMPPVKQTKAIIWKDMHGKKLKHRRPNFIDGDFVSQKMNGKEIHYRSGYERQVYECLEQLPDIVAYDTETLEIPYYLKGERHNYIPDLQIIFADGHIELWEIKPASQTSSPKNTAKRAAAIEYCAIRGWKFQTITEKGIEMLKNRVRLILNEGK